jgi:hypothetical protein
MARSSKLPGLTRRAGLAAATVGCAALLTACGEQPPAEAVANHWDVLGRYCTDCHNDAEFAGNMSLEHVQPQDVAAKPELFEKVVRKLRADLGRRRHQGPMPRRPTHSSSRSSAISTKPQAAAVRSPAVSGCTD